MNNKQQVLEQLVIVNALCKWNSDLSFLVEKNSKI